MFVIIFRLTCVFFSLGLISPFDVQPCAVATWNFGKIAVEKCAEVLANHGSSVDAIERGIREVELDTKDQYFVGVGGLPNSEGVMELDAAIMDHRLRYGAVLALRRIRTPISVARTVMDKCVHNVLAGDGALKWALSNGFNEDATVLTESSKQEWLDWRANVDRKKIESSNSIDEAHPKGHDTVGVICLDSHGRLCVGTSTSGWKFKHPGRIGDAPLIGSGLYCHGRYGAAVATGDGEEIMRTCLSAVVVELMRQGHSPAEACRQGIERMFELPQDEERTNAPDAKMHPKLTVGVIAMDPLGRVGAASTLDESNPHRGKPSFPVACWRASADPAVPFPDNFKFIEASTNGAEF